MRSEKTECKNSLPPRGKADFSCKTEVRSIMVGSDKFVNMRRGKGGHLWWPTHGYHIWLDHTSG